MEWNSIKMSKAEFERLQKEYTAAAIKTAEKAKRSAISKETPVATQQPAPTVGIIYEASSTIAEATEENAAETESVINEIADVSEPVVNKAEKIAISPESNDIEISAEATEMIRKKFQPNLNLKHWKIMKMRNSMNIIPKCRRIHRIFGRKIKIAIPTVPTTASMNVTRQKNIPMKKYLTVLQVCL